MPIRSSESGPSSPCVPFAPGIWDLPTAKAYITNLQLNSCSDAINNAVTPSASGANIGGVTITSVQTITNFQGPGTPTVADTTPPTITAAATPSTLWPPNGNLIAVTVSGTVKDDPAGSGVNPGSVAFYVVDEYLQVQPAGSVTLASDGSYSFAVELPASRSGNDRGDRLYTITVSARDNLGNFAAATTKVTVPHDQRK